MAESIGESPPINHTFYLEMKPARKLRVAIETLADPAFNDGRLQMVQADNQGFGFTVRNASDDIASLKLYPSRMVSFRSDTPLVGRNVPLGLISQRFPDDLDDDEDTVCVFNVLGSDLLCFKFGTNPPCEFSVEFSVDGPRVSWTPKFFSRTVVPNKDLRQMIDYMLQESVNNQTVVDVKETFATFEIGSTKKWKYDYMPKRARRTKVVSLEETYRAYFKWKYMTFFYKASFLHFEFRFCLLSAPENHIMFRFRMGKFGYLMIRMKADSIGPITTELRICNLQGSGLMIMTD